MDITLSLVALILFSPFMAITALAIRSYDGGPVLYKQVRLTKEGKPFKILKLRSMIVDAEKGGVCVGVECYRTLLEMIRENGGSIQKGYSDVVMMSDRGLILVLDGVGGVFYGNGERGEGDFGPLRGARERNLDVAQRNESDVQRARRRARAPPGRSGRGEESRQCGDADEMRGRFGRSVMTT